MKNLFKFIFKKRDEFKDDNRIFLESLIKKGVIIEGDLSGIFIDKSCNIEPGAMISTEYGGRIFIGESGHIRRYAIIASYGGEIEIGKNCIINHFDVLYGHGNLKIGNDVMFAAHSVVIPANHGFESLDVPISRQPLTKKGIIIGDDIWIGAGVKILDGVNIKNGSVIGAGSVVTKDIPKYSIAYGIPAKVISSRK